MTLRATTTMAITPQGESRDALATFGVLAGPRVGEEVPVLQPTLQIGSGAENDVVLEDDSVSKRHASLVYDAGAWRLTDLDSANGTYVESVRLAPRVPTPLPYGAAVRFGGARLQFREVAQADPEGARDAYVEPEAATRLRDERRGFRFPLWALLLVLLIVALIAALFLFPAPQPTPVEAPATAAAPAPPAA